MTPCVNVPVHPARNSRLTDDDKPRAPLSLFDDGHAGILYVRVESTLELNPQSSTHACCHARLTDPDVAQVRCEDEESGSAGISWTSHTIAMPHVPETRPTCPGSCKLIPSGPQLPGHKRLNTGEILQSSMSRLMASLFNLIRSGCLAISVTIPANLSVLSGAAGGAPFATTCPR